MKRELILTLLEQSLRDLETLKQQTHRGDYQSTIRGLNIVSADLSVLARQVNDTKHAYSLKTQPGMSSEELASLIAEDIANVVPHVFVDEGSNSWHTERLDTGLIRPVILKHLENRAADTLAPGKHSK